MIEKLNKTTICSIVFLDIIDYSKKSVSEQIDIKNQFNQLINHSLKDVDENERIILDTGDGAAIAHMGSPEDALFVSLSIRDEVLKSNILSSMPLYVRFGINLGPVRLVSDINGQPNIIGDGINVAQRIMSFAKPNQVVVSRSYYDVTSRLTQEISQMFDYSGIKNDKHMREHEIYAVRLLKEVAPIEVTPIKAVSLKATSYLEPIQHFFKRINWKYVALSLPAILTSVLVIKSAASPSEPMITLQKSTASTAQSQTVATPIQQSSTLLTPNETLVKKPVNSNIQLANYAVDKSKAEKSLDEKVADRKIDITQPTEIQLDKTLPDNKKADKKIAKKSTSKKSVKKSVNELPSEFSAPDSNKAQQSNTVAQAAAPQIAVDTPTTQKSGWKTFTDSVKQGQDRACTQAEITMNQCH
ncbi:MULTISPECIES: adenylate/guanylate cyclase domain-containing protein [Methylotenera]|uniref:adenylate/guanylate cyclase domain-containing protein n=1 Tax=Methylotenera TaxID=359407 RepID=UPI00036A5647|nr:MULTISPECIES: adenylate/guanylate cyclase domain-containing protein [Methylotenera]